MTDRQILGGILVGAALMALGLVPGPLAVLLGRFSTGIDHYQKQIHGMQPSLSTRTASPRHLPGQRWLPVAGAILIVLTLIAASES